MSEEPIVSVVSSAGHYDGVWNALKLIECDVVGGLSGSRRVLIKPNLVSPRRQLASTHVDAVRAVINFISERHSGKLVIAEGPAPDLGNFNDALVNLGYTKLIKEYGLDSVDLNEDDYVEVDCLNWMSETFKLRISKTVLESDYRISVALPKTHDCVIVTLSMKNMVVGSLVRGDKKMLHQGTKAMNLNIANISRYVMPHLGVIDGFLGMEGRGPIVGDPIEFRVAAASVHPVSLDAAVAKLMGFEPLSIGYLHHLKSWGVGVARLDRIETVGVPLERAKRKFKPHPSYTDQLQWK